MNKCFKNLSLITGLVALPAAGLLAQPPDRNLETGEVEVIRDFDARLEETEKLTVNPDLPQVEEQKDELDYQVSDKVMALDYPAPKIRPIAMRRDKIPPSYNGYAKLGYGFPNSPYGEVNYYADQMESFQGGIFLKHHSANDKDIEHQRFMLNQGSVEGTYFADEGFAVTGAAGYTNNRVHLFGYDNADTSFLREEVERNINTFELAGRLFNHEELGTDLNYWADADFYRLNETFAASKETGVLVDLGLTKFFEESHPLTVKLILDFTIFNDTARQELHNFKLQPSYTYNGDVFSVRLGANVISHDDDFRLFPDVEVTVNVLGSQIAAFAGAKGDLQKNNLRSLLAYNPYLNSRLMIENTNFNKFYGGVKGKVGFLEYRGEVGYKNAKNLAFFLSAVPDVGPQQHNVVYDTANVIFINGTIKAKPVEGLEILLTLGQNFFDLKNFDKPWHLPALEANATAIYTSSDQKVRLTGELYVANGVPFIDPGSGDSERLGSLLDLSLGGEYFFSENIGLFVQANNLTDNQRERWYRYPTFGINALGGIIAKF